MSNIIDIKKSIEDRKKENEIREITLGLLARTLYKNKFRKKQIIFITAFVDMQYDNIMLIKIIKSSAFIKGVTSKTRLIMKTEYVLINIGEYEPFELNIDLESLKKDAEIILTNRDS